MRICALADNETALGLKLSGVESRSVGDNEDFITIFKDYLNFSDIGLLIITEELAAKAKEIIAKHNSGGKLPLLVEIKSFFSAGQRERPIESLIKESIGMAI